MVWLRGDSWTFRFWAALLGALCAAILLGVGLGLFHSQAGDDQIILALSVLGGAFGGYLMSGWIGRPGALGVALSLIGCWLAGGLGGAFAGSVFAPVLGTLFGAMLGASMPFGGLINAALWLVCCAVLHWVLGALRARVVARAQHRAQAQP